MLTSRFIYEKIAEAISTLIETGTIREGEKLPSLRRMSQRFACSVSVVMQAYAILESQGKIRSVEKSGFFASPAAEAPLPSPEKEHFSLQSHEAKPLSIFSRIVDASNNRSILPLGAGTPDSSYMPLGILRSEINKVLKEDPSVLIKYSDEQGEEGLRREICKIMTTRGVKTNQTSVLLTNGCTEALSLAVQSCSSPGDVIALESPVFVGIIQLLNVLKRRFITIPTSPVSGMDLEKMEEALQKQDIKCIVMTALYQNPLGFVMPPQKRQEAVALTARYNVALIEDDVYHDCSFTHTQERCLKSFDTTGNVIYCSSFSKTLAPGMRIGWIIGGTRHRLQRDLKISQTLGNGLLFQKVIARVLASPHYENQLLRLQKIMQRHMKEMTALLVSELPEGTAVSQPQGGYYLWVELPHYADSLQLFEDALNEGISIVPGPAFSTENRYLNCMRISFATPIDDAVRRGVKKLASLVLKQKLSKKRK